MNDIRLAWEPENKAPLAVIEARISDYLKNARQGVSLLGNGSLLFSPDGGSFESEARQAMQEARRLANFEVTPLKEGGFLVRFHAALAVFVGQEEFAAVREEIVARLDELKFPEEILRGRDGYPQDHLLVGLYARGKLQRDAHFFHFYKRIAASFGQVGQAPCESDSLTCSAVPRTEHVFLLLSADASLDLSGFSEKFFALIGAHDVELRESSNYLGGEYFRAFGEGVRYTVSLNDEAEFGEFAFSVQIEDQLVPREEFARAVDVLIKTKLLPCGYGVARLENAGQKNQYLIALNRPCN